MYSQEYQQFSASLNELQIQVVAGNTQLASAQAKVANGVFRTVDAKMKLIGESVNDPQISATIEAASQKFQELLFDVIRLTKNALTDRSASNLTALATKNVQACTHMLSLEIIRSNYENSIPVPSDANAERRKYLEDQEALFQAERQAAQVKAREEVEARVREEKERKAKLDKEREDRAIAEQDKKKEEDARKTREQQEIRVNQERMRAARQQAIEQEQADRAQTAAQQQHAEAQREAQRKAHEKAQDEEIRLELLEAQQEVERRIKQERMRLDAQDRDTHNAQTAERARMSRDNAAQYAEEERQRKARSEKEREQAEKKQSEDRVRQMNEMQERKTKEEQERRQREESMMADRDREREAKLKIEQVAREEADKKEKEEEGKRRKEEEDRKRQERERLASEAKKKREEREEEESQKKEEREKELKLAHERRMAAKQELKDREETTKRERQLNKGEGHLSDGEGTMKEKKDKEVVDGSVSPRSRAFSAGTGDKWAQMIAKKQETEFKEDRERIRGRRGGGQKFVDDQVRTLITIIKKLDKESDGLGACTFGVLFKETSDTMPALAATLLQAKKRNIVDFEGDMLMQGVNDDVLITVLTETVADTKIYRSGSFDAKDIQDYIKKQEGSVGPANCIVCSKQVYPTEKVVANDHVMHKSCFRCVQCNTVLKLAAYAYGNGKFYCEPHFQQNFSANGYNF